MATPYGISASRYNGKAGYLEPRDLVPLGAGASTYGALLQTSKPGLTVAPVAGSGADFGADTPGTQSDGLAECITALGTPGGTMTLLPGTFSLGVPLTVSNHGVHMVGSGVGLYGTAGAATVVVNATYAANTANALTVTTSSGFLMENLSLTTAHAQAGYAWLYLNTVSGAVVRDCYFSDNKLFDYKVYLQDCESCRVVGSRLLTANVANYYAHTQQSEGFFTIDNCQVNGGNGADIVFDSTGNGPVYVRGCNITNAATYGVWLYANTGFVTTFHISDCTITSLGTANVYASGPNGTGVEKVFIANSYLGGSPNDLYIVSNMDNWILAGVTLWNAGDDGVYLSPANVKGDGITFSGCQIFSNSTSSSGTYSGVNIASNIYAYFDGCFFGNGPTGTTQGYGINISAALTGGLVTVVGCPFPNNKTAPFLNISNLHTGSTVINNPGFNPQAWLVTTPALPGGTGSTYQVTNANPYPVQVYSGGMSGTHVVSGGTDKLLPVDVPPRLGPWDSVYYAGAVPTSWLWYGL